MGFNIKNEETHRLARQLSKITGESMTEAVTKAVRERLRRVRSGGNNNEDEDALSDRLMHIGRDCAAHLREPFRSAEHGDLLYDDKGLPR